MFIPKDDKLRHKILEILTERMECLSANQNDGINVLRVSVKDLKNKFKLSDRDFNRVTSCLLKENEIQHYYDSNDGVFLVGDFNTPISYYNCKYIKEGRSHALSRVKDYLGLILTVIAIISAIGTGIVAIKKNNKTQKELEEIKTELQLLKSQLYQSNLHK